MFCSDLPSAYVANRGLCFAIGFLCWLVRGSACSNQSLVYIDTANFINFDASADSGFTPSDSTFLPSNCGYNLVAITRYCTEFMLHQEALGTV